MIFLENKKWKNSPETSLQEDREGDEIPVEAISKHDGEVINMLTSFGKPVVAMENFSFPSI